MVWAVVWTLSPGSVPAALLTCGPWSNALVSLNVGFLVCGMPGSWRGLCSPWSSSSVLFPTLLFNQCLWDLLVSGQSAGSRGGRGHRTMVLQGRVTECHVQGWGLASGAHTEGHLPSWEMTSPFLITHHEHPCQEIL